MTARTRSATRCIRVLRSSVVLRASASEWRKSTWRGSTRMFVGCAPCWAGGRESPSKCCSGEGSGTGAAEGFARLGLLAVDIRRADDTTAGAVGERLPSLRPLLNSLAMVRCSGLCLVILELRDDFHAGAGPDA